jgi:hypothetical protein
MSDDTKSLNATHKAEPKAENVPEAKDTATGPVELTAMVTLFLLQADDD